MRVFVDGNPVYKIIDFGLVTADSADANGTMATLANICVNGTPHYMSPEQIANANDLDARSDLWSVGVCMFEMLAGQLPFAPHAENPILIMGAVTSASATDLRDLKLYGMPRVSDGVAGHVAKALSKDRAHRSSDAGHMYDELMGALVDHGDIQYDCFLNYRVWCEGSDAPGNGYCPQIFDTLSSEDIVQERTGMSSSQLWFSWVYRSSDKQCHAH